MNIAKILLGVAIFGSTLACKTENKESDEALAKLEAQTNETARPAEVDPEMAGQLEKQIDERIKRAQEETLDSTASGGQPGNVHLTGAFLQSDAQSLRENIKIQLAVGVGWRGSRPELKSQIKLDPQFPETTKIDLQDLVEEETFSHFGCDDEIPGELALNKSRYVAPVVNEGGIRVAVNTIVFCKTVVFDSYQMDINADRAIFLNSTIELKYPYQLGFFLRTNKIVLLGRNQLSSRAEDSPITIFDSPAIHLTSEKVDGEGTLEISSKGANFTPAQ